MKKPFCGDCNDLSCALRTIARLNTFLSMGAFVIGFVIIFSYPMVFGIDSPVDIILTPVGLVFILEVDNWIFEVAKQFYVKTENKDSWIISASSARYAAIEKRKKSIWNCVKLMILAMYVLALGLAVSISYWEADDLGGGVVSITFRVVVAICALVTLFLQFDPSNIGAMSLEYGEKRSKKAKKTHVVK